MRFVHWIFQDAMPWLMYSLGFMFFGAAISEALAKKEPRPEPQPEPPPPPRWTKIGRFYIEWEVVDTISFNEAENTAYGSCDGHPVFSLDRIEDLATLRDLIQSEGVR